MIILIWEVCKHRIVHKITNCNQDSKAKLSKQEISRNWVTPQANKLPDLHILHILWVRHIHLKRKYSGTTIMEDYLSKFPVYNWKCHIEYICTDGPQEYEHKQQTIQPVQTKQWRESIDDIANICQQSKCAYTCKMETPKGKCNQRQLSSSEIVNYYQEYKWTQATLPNILRWRTFKR